MHLKKYFFVFLTLSFIISFQSCKKSSTDTPAPSPVLPDTLTAGWSKLVLAGETSFSDVFFYSSTTGYLAGSRIYRSIDGGLNWTPVSVNNNIFNMFMTSDTKAYFVSQAGQIVKTTDGGNTFSNVAIAAPPEDIYFIDSNNGFCITTNGMYATTDAGTSWNKLTTTGLPSIGSGYATLSCYNSTTGWVVYQGAIYKTNGSYLSWTQSSVTGGSGGSFVSVYATSATNIYVANSNGEIFKSTDGGISFSFVKKLEGGGYMDIHFINDLNGYASLGRNVFKTTDGGANWSKVVSIGQGSLGELHFTDANHGWVCSDNGLYQFKQ